MSESKFFIALTFNTCCKDVNKLAKANKQKKKKFQKYIYIMKFKLISIFDSK